MLYVYIYIFWGYLLKFFCKRLNDIKYSYRMIIIFKQILFNSLKRLEQEQPFRAGVDLGVIVAKDLLHTLKLPKLSLCYQMHFSIIPRAPIFDGV